MSTTFEDLLDDLAAESEVVEDLLSTLSASEWELPTPADGWSIRDQVSHLAFFDEQAVLAATQPDAFRISAKELLAVGADFPDVVAARYRKLPMPDLLDWYRASRKHLLAEFAALDGRARVPWFGPDMSVISSATARLMETWAHGLDIGDAVGAKIHPSRRLRHIAHLGFRTMGFSFTLRGLPVPDREVRVELVSPEGGDSWTWGPEAATDKVRGTALDFCLVVTQRRHVLDTGLDVVGPVATEWMGIAQAFAGAPGPGRQPQTIEEAS